MKEELMTICDSCNEPTEVTTWRDCEEVCYGHGQVSTDWFECEGSECCHSETTEWREVEWVYEYPEIALEFGYITEETYKRMKEELE